MTKRKQPKRRLIEEPTGWLKLDWHEFNDFAEAHPEWFKCLAERRGINKDEWLPDKQRRISAKHQHAAYVVLLAQVHALRAKLSDEALTEPSGVPDSPVEEREHHRATLIYLGYRKQRPFVEPVFGAEYTNGYPQTIELREQLTLGLGVFGKESPGGVQ